MNWIRRMQRFGDDHFGAILVSAFILCVAAAIAGMMHDERRTADLRRMIARECGSAAHYMDCRQRLLDRNGWADPDRRSGTSTPVVVPIVR